MKHGISIPCLVLALAAPSIAFAEPTATDPAAAQALFADARTLMQRGRYAEACPKLEESLRLDNGLGTRFNLADCHEHVGRLASAWAGFLDVAAEAKSAGQTEREKFARKRAAALEVRLPKLVVDASRASDGIEVKRDDVTLGPAALGTAIPVDPGLHRVTATAPGKRWEVTVSTAEGRTTRVLVPADLPDAAVTTTAAQAPSSGPQATDFPPPVVERGGAVQRTAGWVVTGLGVASLAVGGGFGVWSVGQRNASRSHCSGAACDAEGVALREDAIRKGNIATAAVIGGSIAAATGLVLVLTAPKNHQARERAGTLRAVPAFAGTSGGLFLQGSFQ